MIISTVVAVALGLIPVKESNSPQLVQPNDKIAAQIGRYEQFIGRDGRTHVSGYDRLGRGYDIAIDSKGHVDGEVGDWLVSFDASEPA